MQNNIEEIKMIYPQYESNKDYYDKRFEKVEKGFLEYFGEKEEVRFFSAPGRIEIGGNHTDHQHGNVLAASIDLDVLGAVAKTEKMQIRLFSEGFGMTDVDLSDFSIVDSEKNTTKALIRGIFSKISSMGYTLGGLDIYCTSSVLGGSGLSSSAAFEIFIGNAINSFYCQNAISDVELAKIGQYAENVYFGKPCGLMDQMASSVGNVVAIDFENPNEPIIQNIDFPIEKMGHAICIIDSGADHANLTNEYAEIAYEMKAVAGVFGKEYLRQVSKEMLLECAAEVCKKTSDRAFLRSLHFFNDSENAVLEAQALKEKNYDKFLELVTKSGQSSFMYLQNIYAISDFENQKVAVALALCQEFLQGKGAYRVHGGGFAGTVQAFVPIEILQEFKEKIESILGKDKCYILSIRQLGGTEIK